MRALDHDLDELETKTGLVIQTSTRAGRVLDEFYRGYDAAFVLASEKERIEGFAECLALNQGSAYVRLEAALGAFREVVMVIRDRRTRAMIGGANFIAFPIDEARLSMNLNYIYVLPAHRQRGYFRSIVGSLGDAAASRFEPHPQGTPLIFIEQNDPIRMSASDYVRDTTHSGLDQWQRLEIWARLGALVVDFPYVQPALSDDQQPEDCLIYSVLGAESPALPACTLHRQLERFFAISVLKGKPTDSCAVVRDQLTHLAGLCAANQTITLLDPKLVLEQHRLGLRSQLDTKLGFRALAFRRL